METLNSSCASVGTSVKLILPERVCRPQSAFCLAINQSFHKVPGVWVYMSET